MRQSCEWEGGVVWVGGGRGCEEEGEVIGQRMRVEEREISECE